MTIAAGTKVGSYEDHSARLARVGWARCTAPRTQNSGAT